MPIKKYYQLNKEHYKKYNRLYLRKYRNNKPRIFKEKIISKIKVKYSEEERKEARRIAYRKFMEKHPNYWMEYQKTERYRQSRGYKTPYKGKVILSEEERKLRKKQRERKYRESIKNNPIKYKQYLKNWRRNNPDYIKTRFKEKPEEYKKYLVRQALNREIIKGNIIRQFCQVEGCKFIGEAHHDDYNKPFDVKWLCKLHHEEYHKNLVAQK